MTNSDQSKTFCMRKTWVKRVSHVWQGAIRCKIWHPAPSITMNPHLVLFICISIHTLPPSPLYVRALAPAIDFWLNVHISLRPALWHPLIGLILIWYQITDTVVTLWKRLHSTSDLAFASVWHPRPHPLHFSLYSSQCLHAEPLFHVDYITARLITHKHTANLRLAFSNTLAGYLRKHMLAFFFFLTEEIQNYCLQNIKLLS